MRCAHVDACCEFGTSRRWPAESRDASGVRSGVKVLSPASPLGSRLRSSVIVARSGAARAGKHERGTAQTHCAALFDSMSLRRCDATGLLEEPGGPEGIWEAEHE